MKTNRLSPVRALLLATVVTVSLSSLLGCSEPMTPQPEPKNDFVNPPRVATVMPEGLRGISLMDSLGRTACTCMPKPTTLVK